MLSVDYTYSSRQARDLLKALDKNVREGLEELVWQWVEHYRAVAQPAIFEAHEGTARTGVGAGEHPSWEALSETYVDSRRKRESPHAEDIMQLSGALRSDLETGQGEGYTTSEHHGDSVVVEIGSRRQYGVWAGGGQGGPRQVMYLTAQTIQELETITNTFISRVIVEARGDAGLGAGGALDRAAAAVTRTTARGGGRL